ncbi:MAG: hypothetical protein Q8N18_06995 [Opitutaceae bacterium]|nr:hypothetical protein [Opitutaceae bacterium]
MTLCILITLGLLTGAGFLWRELRRAPLLPPGHDEDGQPMNAFQAGVKLDRRTADAPDAATRARLMEKLRAEEIRQRPQEGRN